LLAPAIVGAYFVLRKLAGHFQALVYFTPPLLAAFAVAAFYDPRRPIKWALIVASLVASIATMAIVIEIAETFRRSSEPGYWIWSERWPLVCMLLAIESLVSALLGWLTSATMRVLLKKSQTSGQARSTTDA
jgi:hypothetical protein